MTVSEEVYENEMYEIDLAKLKINKKYLELFKEICEEKNLDFNEELKARIEAALVDSFKSYHSECIHDEKALGFLKGGKAHRRVPGFDIEHIKRMLQKFDTIDEQIEWLKNYVDGLQKTKETIYLSPRGLPTTMTREEHNMGLVPYMKIVPQAIQDLQKLIRVLEAEKIIQEKITHKY